MISYESYVLEYEMTAENFDAMIQRLLLRRPFRIFTIQLLTGERLQVDHPTAVATQSGMALFLGPGKVIHEFDHNRVLQFVEETADSAA